MRNEAVNELLDDVYIKLKEIERIYLDSKRDENIERIKNPIIKNTLENLRSCLDYSACDIYEYVYSADIEECGKKVYFPYAKTKSKFKEIINKSFPSLKSKNEVLYNSILSLQSFASKDSFLYELCQITNYYKHNSSKKQKRVNEGKVTTDLKFKNMQGSFIRLEGESSILLEDCVFSDGKNTEIVNNIELNTGRKVDEMNKELGSKLLLERNYEKVKYDIDGIDIYIFIESAYKHIKDYLDFIYRVMNRN